MKNILAVLVLGTALAGCQTTGEVKSTKAKDCPRYQEAIGDAENFTRNNMPQIKGEAAIKKHAYNYTNSPNWHKLHGKHYGC